MRNPCAAWSPIGRFCFGGVILLVLTAMSASGSLSNRDPEGEEAERIEATLNDYLYGIRDGDVERLRRAFHSTAEIEGVRDGMFTSWSTSEYISGIRPYHRQDFVPRILAVDQVGSAAMGKLEEDHGTWRFVDYMQLLRIDGQWKIVNKVSERVVDVVPGQ